MYKSNSWSGRSQKPDVLMEELVTALLPPAWAEFKALFPTVHAALRLRKAANGGEEMLRLRIYEKLQNLVRMGGVEKCGKEYRAIPAGLSLLTKHFAADHCRNLLAVVDVATPEAS